MGGSTMIVADDIPSLVHLNVGGTRFSTSMDTLTQREPDSMLATMFSGRHNLCRDGKGYVFIDRDGEHFRHILNWLRDGEIPKLEDSVLVELLKEAQYYQLLGLIDATYAILSNEGNIDLKKNSNEEKEKRCRDLTRNDIIKLMQSGDYRGLPRHSLKFRDFDLSGLDLSGMNMSYVNFNYSCMRNVCFSNAYLVHAMFNKVDAQGANFRNAKLQGCKFRGANLKGASFRGANVEGIDLSEACLTDCKFDKK